MTAAHDPDGLSRRRLLQLGGSLAAVWGTGALAGCSSGGTSTGSSGGSEKPVRGGTFTVGMMGAGAAEHLDPIPFQTGYSDGIRQSNLFDPLFFSAREFGKLDPGLAVSAEPDATGAEWVFKLRDGVEWHDGKPFGADDVVYTFQQWGKPTSQAFGTLGPVVDFKSVRKSGPLEVRVPLLRPVAQFDTLLVGFACLVVQDGATAADFVANPVGTGPFAYDSFEAGVSSTFTAFENYWQEGMPYVDELIINSSFDDETARLNALLSGEINVLPQLTPLQAKQYESSSEIQVKTAETGITRFFSMRADVAPFNDVRVRQAIRLAVDRQALIDGAMSGYGVAASDLFGRGSEYYAADLVREQDTDQAKSLLASAGVSDLQFEISTSHLFPQGVEAATLLSEQLKAVGVDARVKVIPPGNYFVPSTGWPYPMGQDTTITTASLSGAWSLPWLPAEVGEGAIDSKILQEAMAAKGSAAEQAWAEFQQSQFDSGAFLGWVDGDALDAYAPDVRGLEPTAAGSLNAFRLVDGWIA